MMIILEIVLMIVLIYIGYTDYKTMEIPMKLNILVLIIGILLTICDRQNYVRHLIGLVAISGPLYIIYVISQGKAIGGGDIKLMAAAGVALGYERIIFAFLLACVIASIVHTILMKLKKASHIVCFGPYLATGIIVSLLIGYQVIGWYMSLLIT